MNMQILENYCVFNEGKSWIYWLSVLLIYGLGSWKGWLSLLRLLPLKAKENEWTDWAPLLRGQKAQTERFPLQKHSTKENVSIFLLLQIRICNVIKKRFQLNLFYKSTAQTERQAKYGLTLTSFVRRTVTSLNTL